LLGASEFSLVADDNLLELLELVFIVVVGELIEHLVAGLRLQVRFFYN
jgi:hypothetical protein